jgi:ATP phosphoribosyltransferase
LVGLADGIVDLVSSGSTLRANGLIEVEDVLPISARLIANQASLKTRAQPIGALLAAIEAVLGAGARP